VETEKEVVGGFGGGILRKGREGAKVSVRWTAVGENREIGW
jgi:hypothetical protein